MAKSVSVLANHAPKLELSQADKDELKAYAATLVDETIDQYHEHYTMKGGAIKTGKWKKVKQQDDLCVYKKVKGKGSSTTTSNSASHGSSSSGSYHTNSDSERSDLTTVSTPSEWEENEVSPEQLLGVGTIPGMLEDVMLGVHTPTVELMMLKSAYINDGYVDWAVLSTLVHPTPADPFRELSVKWFVKTHPTVVNAIMRKRDVVYIESTGITTTETGERIGYQLKHSLDLSEARELTAFKIARTRVSVAYCYRQLKENVVDMYCRAYISIGGDAPSALAVATAASTILSARHAAQCGLMHKIEWLLKTSQLERDSQLVASVCAVCRARVGTGFSVSTTTEEKTCRVCGHRLCSRCRVSKTMYLVAPLTKTVECVKITVCTPCIIQASETSAKVVAWDHGTKMQ